jgi:putative transposase
MRKPLRLHGFNYASETAYYITICVLGRLEVLSTITKDEHHLTPLGQMAEAEWLRTPTLREYVRLGTFIIMPDHIHGIIILDKTLHPGTEEPAFKSPARTIGAIVRGFKAAMVTEALKTGIFANNALWQSRYYDHIIRDGPDYERITHYIDDNPRRWREKHGM